MRFVRGLVVVSLAWSMCLAPERAAAQRARPWVGRAAEIEAFIRTAEVVSVEDIGVGVTNPKRVELEAGGPIDEVAFKSIRSGIYSGSTIWLEDYRSEIAAYELDKYLGLGMTPPTVEKRIGGDLGAASMWVPAAESFKELGGTPRPPSTRIGQFNWDLIRAKMFHNLIYNRDPNLGNWLIDADWNLVLIDNSRAFTRGRDMVHDMTRVDTDLWARVLALDEVTLTALVGDWLDGGGDRSHLAAP